MIKWNVMSQATHNWIGSVWAETEPEAIKKASVKFKMLVYVENDFEDEEDDDEYEELE